MILIFVCSWFDEGEDDGQLERELVLTDIQTEDKGGFVCSTAAYNLVFYILQYSSLPHLYVMPQKQQKHLIFQNSNLK